MKKIKTESEDKQNKQEEQIELKDTSTESMNSEDDILANKNLSEKNHEDKEQEKSKEDLEKELEETRDKC